MSGYRPRLPEIISCAHCGDEFETRHRKAMYCTSACRTQAYRARQGIEPKKTKKAKGELNLSPQNVGVVASGAGISAIANYLFNDAPAQKAMMAKLSEMDKDIEFGLNQLINANQLQIDFINAMVDAQPGLRRKIEEIQQKRQSMINAAKEKQSTALDLLAQHKKRNKMK